MNKLAAMLHARLDLWGTRLNMIAALLIAYMAANGAAVEKAVNSVISEPYRPIASLLIGVLSYLIVNGVAKRDAKKVGNE